MPATAACGNPSAPAAPAGSTIGSEKVGRCCVIHANVKSLPSHVSETGVGPMPRPNMNSFRAVYHAIEYETERQARILDDGGRVAQETRGWVDNQNRTVSQRSKVLFAFRE